MKNKQLVINQSYASKCCCHSLNGDHEISGMVSANQRSDLFSHRRKGHGRIRRRLTSSFARCARREMTDTTRTRQPAVFVPHGGGPMPILGDPGHAEMVQWLKSFRKTFIKTKPDAIVLVTAHWEEKVTTITSAAQPKLLYDYYGFPPKAYDIKYPAPGHPELADRIKALLGEQRIPAKLDDARGNDHGVFIPMKLMFPSADIPVVQMSIYDSLNPEQHIKLGEALSSLRDDNILIVGSGLSFHSFKYFFGDKVAANRVSVPFHEYLVDALVNTTNPSERRKKLSQWSKAPFAREVHPREEHLMPLLVIAGAGLREPCQEIFSGLVMDIRTSGFLFGGETSTEA